MAEHEEEMELLKSDDMEEKEEGEEEGEEEGSDGDSNGDSDNDDDDEEDNEDEGNDHVEEFEVDKVANEECIVNIDFLGEGNGDDDARRYSSARSKYTEERIACFHCDHSGGNILAGKPGAQSVQPATCQRCHRVCGRYMSFILSLLVY